MAHHAMEGAQDGAGFIEHVQPGDILVAGKNFGCGSSREHATVAIKGIGISVVIARSFARIFRRNAVNTGLPILQFNSIEDLPTGSFLEIELDTGKIHDRAHNKTYHAETVSDLELSIMKAGGLLPFLKTVQF